MTRVRVYLRRLSDGFYWSPETKAYQAAVAAWFASLNSDGRWRVIENLPAGADLPPGRYRAFAVAVDRAYNNSTTAQKTFIVPAPAGATTPQTRATSPVTLSSVSADATRGTVTLTFTGALGASAGDPASYSVTTNETALPVRDATLRGTNAVVLHADGFTTAQSLAVTYDIEDASGLTLTGVDRAVAK